MYTYLHRSLFIHDAFMLHLLQKLLVNDRFSWLIILTNKVEDSPIHNYVPQSPCLCLRRTFKRPISTVNAPRCTLSLEKWQLSLLTINCKRRLSFWIWLCYMQLMFKMLGKLKENCFKCGSTQKRLTLDDYQQRHPHLGGSHLKSKENGNMKT